MMQVIYNVTVSVDEDVAPEWLRWMQEVHIPDVMNTGKFLESRLSKVLGFEEGGVTYAVQYICKDMDTYERYQLEDAPELQQEHIEKFGSKAVAFRTLLHVHKTFVKE